MQVDRQAQAAVRTLSVLLHLWRHCGTLYTQNQRGGHSARGPMGEQTNFCVRVCGRHSHVCCSPPLTDPAWGSAVLFGMLSLRACMFQAWQQLRKRDRNP